MPRMQTILILSSLSIMSVPAFADIVINEIHYDPEPKTEHVEFIEIYNAGENAVNLSGWSFDQGIDYQFTNVTLAAGQYWVLTENKSQFDAKFGSVFVGGTPADAEWEAGTLQNEGERITLLDASGEEVDTVNYRSEFPWPIAPNGEGVSMELLHPSLDNNLGGSWRAALSAPTPGKANSVLTLELPPLLRQVNHFPEMPRTDEEALVTVKATDLDGVSAVELQYQIVEPGNYIQSLLAKSSSEWRSRPEDPREPNPDYNDPANWTNVPMSDNGMEGDVTAGDDIYSIVLPPQPSRTIVRYRIVATDQAGHAVQVPYPDDPSLNFAYFSYDGVPSYTTSEESVHPEGHPHTYPAEVMQSLPVYTLVCDAAEFAQCIAYSGGDQVGRDNFAARSAFNWSGSFVYNNKVYDHIKFRLRQRNDRYGGGGKRSMRFRFNRGNYIQLHDNFGRPYPEKARTINSSKMRARGGKNFGLHEGMNNWMWNTVGVPAPRTHWFHFRVVKGKNEVPPGSIFGPNVRAQYEGDFFGMSFYLEDYDSRFLNAHDMEDGNLYKLISTRTNGLDVMRNQGKYSVTDGSDFSHILENLRPARDVDWLNTYVDYDHYARYHAIVECVRHYDVQPNLSEHLKNRSFYFSPPTPDNALGQVHTHPWDSDTSWGPNWNSGVDYAKDSLFRGQDREAMLTAYRNTIREVRDLIWQSDQINPALDQLHGIIAPFVLADRDRWNGGTTLSGQESIGDVADKVADMKKYAWEGGRWTGGEGNDPSKDGGISGQEGRDAYLDFLAKDGIVPTRPTISYDGPADYPVDQIRFASSGFKTSIFGGKPFAGMEWRLAEITDPSLPDYDPNEPFQWEYQAVWKSEVLVEDNLTMAYPATAMRVGRSYRARVRYLATDGKWSSWSEPHQFTAGEPATLFDLQKDLVISEIMYHPGPLSEAEMEAGYSRSHFEYIELWNRGETTLDLSPVRFTKGIDFDFADSAVTSLAPGAYVLIVSDETAFQLRYGEGPWPIAGAFGQNDAGRLSNGGELLKLSFGGGTPIHEFYYDDSGDWAVEADGSGASLVLNNPLTETIEYALGASWTVSVLGGSPNGPDEIGPSQLDSDGDGVSDAAEALAGTDPDDSSSFLRITQISRDFTSIHLEWTHVEGKTYEIEFAADLSSDWESVAEVIGGEHDDDSAERLAFPQAYYRVRVK